MRTRVTRTTVVKLGLVAFIGLVALLGTAQTNQLQSSKERTLYSFTGGSANGDGIYPHAGLVRDSQGNLYGTTYFGAITQSSGGNPGGCGVVFKVDSSRKETVLYKFTGYPSDGCNPEGGVILDSSGNLYGTTYFGGGLNYGRVFELNSSGNETDLYDFLGFNSFNGDGAYPNSTLVRDKNGNVFGTTPFVGTNGYGEVFKIDSKNNYTVLYNFPGAQNGAYPSRSRLLLDAAGNLYGLTAGGGSSSCSCGVVYKVTASGSESVLYSFQGGNDGTSPIGDLVRDKAGNFYGATQYGGKNGNGIVFRLNPSGQETALYTFRAGLDGVPSTGVVLDASGNLYGTTTIGGSYHRGSVFKLDSSGKRTEVYSFTGKDDGGRPWGSLLRDARGHLYGTTIDGGTNRQGAVFEIIP